MYLMQIKSIASRYTFAKRTLNDPDSHNTLKCWHMIPVIVRTVQYTTELKPRQRNSRYNVGVPGRITTYCMTDHYPLNVRTGRVKRAQKLTFNVYMKYAYKSGISDVNYGRAQGALWWGDTANSKTTHVLSRTVERSPGDPYRCGKRPFALPCEGTFSGMPCGRRSDIFDEE